MKINLNFFGVTRRDPQAQKLAPEAPESTPDLMAAFKPDPGAVFCRDCVRYRPSPSDSDYAKCDMGESTIRYEQDYVTGEIKTIHIGDQRKFCGIKNRNGRCRDFLGSECDPIEKSA